MSPRASTVLLAVLLAPATAAAKPAKLGIPAGGGDLVLWYDTAKISEADLRAAAAFAPDAGPDAITTGDLETCRDPAGKTTACGAATRTPLAPAYMRDAALTVAENHDRVAAAAAVKVPKELEPAKEWMRRYIAFYAGLEDRKLAFYTSWKTADLVPPIEGVDGAKTCAALVAKIDAAATKEAKYVIVRNEWHNCMNDRAHDLMGEYPKAPWQAFLKAYKVKAKFVMQQGD